MSFVSIDLGTSRCSIVIYRDGKLELVKDPEADTPYVTPYITFGSLGWLIGEKAFKEQQTDASKVVVDIKLLLSAKSTDLARHISSWPFDVVTEQDEIAVKMGRHVFTAEELIQILIHTFLQWAEKQLGEPIKEMLLNFSPQFDKLTRDKFQNAAFVAGAEKVYAIDDQMAAALVYHHHRSRKETIKLVIVSQGSSCFAASIFELSDEDPIQIGFVCDEENGGDCYDRTLKSHVIDEFCKKHNQAWEGNRSDNYLLLQLCKQAKHELTKRHQTQIRFPDTNQDLSIEQTYNRQSFETINESLFKRSVSTLNSLFEQTKVQRSEISEVMLVGGATRVPKLLQLIHNYFEGKVTVSTKYAFDHVFACGGALHLAKLNQLTVEDFPDQSFWINESNTMLSDHNISLDSKLLEPIGFRIASMPAVTMFKANENIPNRSEYTVITTMEFQTPSLLHVWVGGDLDGNVTNDDIVCTVVCPEITPTPKGTPILCIIFELDEYGCLTVTIRDTCSGMSKTETISNLVTVDFQQSRSIRRLNRCQSQLRRDVRNIARILDSYNAKSRLSAEQIETIKQKCEAIDSRLSLTNQTTVDYLDEKRRELFSTWMPYVPLLYPDNLAN